MSNHPDDRDLLPPEDAAFVRRVADLYAPPPLTPGRRAAFDAALEARIARDRWRFAPWAAAVAVAGAAALALLLLPSTATIETARAPADASAEDEFVLSLAGESAADFETSLPADYQAIASLLAME